MDRPIPQNDFFSFGLVVSLSCHLFLVFILVPVAPSTYVATAKSQSVFLGSILKESDLIPPSYRTRQERPLILGKEDFSKVAHIEKPFFFVRKPDVRLGSQETQKQGSVSLSPQSRSPKKVLTAVSFGFSDFSNFVYNVDFSDLRYFASREELSSAIDFKVILNQKGEVVDIRKIAGSGDPSLDLNVMLKLKVAVFRSSSFSWAAGEWLNVRFKVKE